MNSIWKSEISSGLPVRLTDNVIGSPLNLSPNQKWIAYTVDTLPANQQLKSIWIVGTQGGQALKVSNEAPLVELAWTDESWLVFTEYPDFRIDQDTGHTTWGQGVTYAFGPETGEKRPMPSLTPRTDHSQCRVFLAQGRLRDMAEWCSGDSDKSFLRIVELDGTKSVILATPYRGREVIWSFNGDKLAFSSVDASGNSQLFIWSRVDNDTKQIDLGKVSFIAPAWSPDDEWIAFESDGNNLCVVNTDTGELKCFYGYVSALGVPPAWSPDSRAVVLASNRIGRLALEESSSDWDLFAISVPSGKVTRITHDAKTESRPVWGK